MVDRVPVAAPPLHASCAVSPVPLPPPRHPGGAGFRVVIADPAWPWEAWSDKGYGRSPEAHYRTMPYADIEALWDRLGLDRVVARDVLLALWARGPDLDKAFAVLRAWRFAYSTAAPWVKTSKAGWPEDLAPVAGNGKFLRAIAEYVLFGQRGSPRIRRPLPLGGGVADLNGGDSLEANIVLFAPRRDEHPRKPGGLHALFEAVTDGPGLELFARETRPGWVGWGDQVGVFDPPSREASAGRMPGGGERRMASPPPAVRTPAGEAAS